MNVTFSTFSSEFSKGKFSTVMTGEMDLNRKTGSEFSLVIEMNLSATCVWHLFCHHDPLCTFHQQLLCKKKNMTLKNTVIEHDLFFAHLPLINSPVKHSG